jgi:hypothetical protein
MLLCWSTLSRVVFVDLDSRSFRSLDCEEGKGIRANRMGSVLRFAIMAQANYRDGEVYVNSTNVYV